MFRRNRISDEQLQEILRNLPQAKASTDLESQLGRMIAAHSDHVPSLLGSLPMVPAPDDFDARLMEAIHERRRPVAPIPVAVTAGSASVNWLNHIMGWIGGSLAVVAVAFFINNADDLQQEAARPVDGNAPSVDMLIEQPVPSAEPVATSKVNPPAGRAVMESRDAEPVAGVARETETPTVAQPATVVHTRAQRSADAPALLQTKRTVEIDQQEKAPALQEKAAAVHEKPQVDPLELSTPLESATSRNTDTSAEIDKGGAVPNGVVNTGGDREDLPPKH